MKLEVGKRYKTRNGMVVDITGFRENYFLGRSLDNSICYNWYENGCYSLIGETGHDLIEELPDDPKPTADDFLREKEALKNSDPEVFYDRDYWRYHFAGLAMQSQITAQLRDPEVYSAYIESGNEIKKDLRVLLAENAVNHADDLLSVLEKWGRDES